MKNEEAKFILHAYRPNGGDAGDPVFAAALAQAKQDPAMGKWFSAQQAFDRAICAKLGAVPPPADLRASILAGAKFSEERRQPATRVWWQSRGLLGMAASAMVLLAATFTLWPKAAEAQPVMIDFALNDTLRKAHGGHGGEAGEFQKLLGTTNTHLGRGLPVDFEGLKKGGCRTISFEGRDILEVCFSRDGNWFHCYVARVSDFPAIAEKLQLTFRDGIGASAVAWADEQHIFVVASKAGRDAIKRLI